MDNEIKEIEKDTTEVVEKEPTVKVFDLSQHLSQATAKPVFLQNDNEIEVEEIETEIKEVDVPDAENEFEEIENGEIEIDEVEEQKNSSNPKPNLFNSSTVATIIANSHHAFLPPARLWFFKKTFFKAGEFEKAQEVNAKIIKAATDDNAPFKPTDYEKKLSKSYQNYCNYRDNKIELSQKNIDDIEAAWKWQLIEWGFDNVSLGLHPMAEVYGSLLISDGLNIIETNFKN